MNKFILRNRKYDAELKLDCPFVSNFFTGHDLIKIIQYVKGNIKEMEAL